MKTVLIGLALLAASAPGARRPQYHECEAGVCLDNLVWLDARRPTPQQLDATLHNGLEHDLRDVRLEFTVWSGRNVVDTVVATTAVVPAGAGWTLQVPIPQLSGDLIATKAQPVRLTATILQTRGYQVLDWAAVCNPRVGC